MTKEDFLIVSDLLTVHKFDELDKLEFFMEYEQKSNTNIPEEWFSEAQLEKSKTQSDWESFRRDCAKDILTGILSNPIQISIGDKSIKTVNDYLSLSVELADELIKRLKEK